VEKTNQNFSLIRMLNLLKLYSLKNVKIQNLLLLQCQLKFALVRIKIIICIDKFSIYLFFFLKYAYLCLFNVYIQKLYYFKIFYFMWTEKCKDCSFVFNGKVITQVQELWNNINVNVLNNTVIKTVQVDLCNGADICFDKTDSFNRVVWAATEKLKIHFKEKEAGIY